MPLPNNRLEAALIVDELRLFVATQQLLARKRLQVPEDVSLVSMASDPAFEWGSRQLGTC